MPCDAMTQCQNLAPGFSCTSCPPGYTSPRVRGIGVEYARRNKQICRDVNECEDGNNGGCVPYSTCHNTVVSMLRLKGEN